MYKEGMTVKEAADMKGLNSYDTALPQAWVDTVCKVLPDNLSNLMGNVVWCYRWEAVDFDDIWGRPVAISPHGELIIGWLAAALK